MGGSVMPNVETRCNHTHVRRGSVRVTDPNKYPNESGCDWRHGVGQRPWLKGSAPWHMTKSPGTWTTSSMISSCAVKSLTCLTRACREGE
eukprot:14025036-Ditylum_brightwellii.AAC.1